MLCRETRIGLLALLGLVLFALCLVSVRFARSFLPSTELRGILVTSATPEEVLADICGEAAGRTITLLDEDGEEILVMSVLDFVPQEKVQQKLQDLLAEQHADVHALSWVFPQSYSETLNLFDTLKVRDVSAILADALYRDRERTSPEDARLVSDKAAGYAVAEESKGHFFRTWDCAQSVFSALEQMDGQQCLSDCTLSVPTARVEASVTVDSPMLQRAKDVLDSFIQSQITVDFLNGTLVTLTPAEIISVGRITIDGLKTAYEADYGKVKTLADGLLELYAAEGIGAKYGRCVQTRETVYYPDWDAGWILNRDAFEDSLYAAICGQEDVTVTPEYDSTYDLRSIYWCGNSVIEISLDNQYLWMYVNDKLLVETPVVTGNLASGAETRRGHFMIYWMEQDLYLSGPTWYDHVDFWMPFDGGIGLHDSSWRDAYGGDIYIEDGSHGCINTPWEAMRTVYENAWFYMPVVVW